MSIVSADDMRMPKHRMVVKWKMHCADTDKMHTTQIRNLRQERKGNWNDYKTMYTKKINSYIDHTDQNNTAHLALMQNHKQELTALRQEFMSKWSINSWNTSWLIIEYADKLFVVEMNYLNSVRPLVKTWMLSWFDAQVIAIADIFKKNKMLSLKKEWLMLDRIQNCGQHKKSKLEWQITTLINSNRSEEQKWYVLERLSNAIEQKITRMNNKKDKYTETMQAELQNLLDLIEDAIEELNA
jgi:hypothetical protein